MPISTDSLPAKVPLGTGPPTREELIAYYPAKFAWRELRAFVASGDLRLLKRDENLNRRYKKWCEGIKKDHGSLVNYLVNHRLQWGNCKPDALAAPASAERAAPNGTAHCAPRAEHFTADIPHELICIIANDWPYSVPSDISHDLVWTKLPILHHSLVDPAIRERLDQDGLCGFSGTLSPPPSPSKLEKSLPALKEWGVTMDALVISPPPTDAEKKMIDRAGCEVRRFVERRWREDEWETAWFVNPPRTQSVPGLAHFHVFARRKTSEEGVAWRKAHLER